MENKYSIKGIRRAKNKIIKVINKTGDKSINATMKVFEYGDYPIHSITYDNLLKMSVTKK